MQRAGRANLSLPPYVNRLQAEFCRRRADNHQYSMRAFSRDLGLSPGAVSEILVGKRPLTAKGAKKVADRLGLSPTERASFLTAVKLAEGVSAMTAATHAASLDERYSELSDDVFATIAEPYHYYILNLFKTINFDPDPTWIARRLGLSVHEVRHALDRLVRLGLLAKDGAVLRRTEQRLTTTVDVPSTALRRSHQKSIEEAITALHEVAVELRDISSITLPLNTEQLPYVKQLIAAFRRSVAEVVEQERGDEVYNLNIQLVPVTKPGAIACKF